MTVSKIRQVAYGRALRTRESIHQTIGKTVGLAVFASDSLSSVAYAGGEILLILAVLGASAYWMAIPITVAICGLLILLTLSYRQTIFAYPSGRRRLHRLARQLRRAHGPGGRRRTPGRLHPDGRREHRRRRGSDRQHVSAPLCVQGADRAVPRLDDHLHQPAGGEGVGARLRRAHLLVRHDDSCAHRRWPLPGRHRHPEPGDERAQGRPRGRDA